MKKNILKKNGSTNKAALTWIGIAAVITFIAYMPSLQNGFVNWDDPEHIYENINIRSVDINFFVWAFKSVVVGNWLPLTLFSYAIDYSIWGLNPVGYHLTNILLHAINTFLVGVLAMRLLCFKGVEATMVVFSAFVTAALFGLHPLHVESVVWVSERKDVLSALFFIMSILFYLSYVSRSSWFFYSASLLSFVFALMSKPMAITLPAILLILDFYPLERLSGLNKGIKQVMAEKVPFLSLSLLSAIITLWAQRHAISSFESLPLISRLYAGARALVFYLYKIICPFILAPYYPHPLEIKLLELEYIGAIVILCLITVLCLLKIRKMKFLMATWLYYLITLSPVIGIVQVGAQAAADRYMYLPSLSLFLLAGVGVAQIARKIGGKMVFAVAYPAVCALVAVLVFLTVKQTTIWKDSVTLWSHEIEYIGGVNKSKSVPLVIAYYNRAKAYDQIGDTGRAIEDYSRVIFINPEFVNAYNNRGIAYGTIGDFENAIMDFDTALSLNPGDPEATYNRELARKAMERGFN